MTGARVSHIIGILLVGSGLLTASQLAAEELPVYESLKNVEIGRIFLSPEQRRNLDARRGEKAPVVSTQASTGKSAARHSPDAAGFITRSGGPSRVWSNGNFVPSDDVSDVTFPGDVEVTRGQADETDADAGIPDNGS